MKYNDLTDYEINKLVTMKLFGFIESEYSEVSGNFHKGDPKNKNYKVGVIHDYCNNPSDAWPIILDNMIDISFLKCEQNTALSSNGDDYVRDKNPLRAAMIIYLMKGDN